MNLSLRRNGWNQKTPNWQCLLLGGYIKTLKLYTKFAKIYVNNPFHTKYKLLLLCFSRWIEREKIDGKWRKRNHFLCLHRRTLPPDYENAHIDTIKLSLSTPWLPFILILLFLFFIVIFITIYLVFITLHHHHIAAFSQVDDFGRSTIDCAIFVLGLWFLCI